MSIRNILEIPTFRLTSIYFGKANWLNILPQLIDCFVDFLLIDYIVENYKTEFIVKLGDFLRIKVMDRKKK